MSESDTPTAVEKKASETAFSESNRRRLIKRFFEERGAPTAPDAWQHVYRLLLWIDNTTGLAHCYESDKCQPGRLWYARTLTFHAWLAAGLGTTPTDLGGELDWLFRRVLDDYLKAVAAQREKLRAAGGSQRAVHAPLVFPLPGADPEIQRLVTESLGAFMGSTPTPEVFERLSEELHAYWKQENKRKNLLGEGFEDVLAAVVTSASGGGIHARTRTGVARIEGFAAPGAKDKATKIDLVLDHPSWEKPALVNVKWSFRADREDQLWDDFNDYVRHDQAGANKGFTHYLVTNEFDPARLNSVCDRRASNHPVFDAVVHINTEGLLAAHQDVPVAASPLDQSGGKGPAKQKAAVDSSRDRVRVQIEKGRLIGLARWLQILSRAV